MSTNSTASPEGCSASAIHVSIMPIITYVSFHLYPRSLVRLSTATPNNVQLSSKLGATDACRTKCQAKLDEEDDTHISTRVAGTIGYMAPEYATRGHLTEKADVYSFGIVALEIALVLKEQGNLMELVDTDLGSNFDKEQLMVMINVALLCASASPTNRPSMSSVLSMLECGVDVPDLVSDSSISEVDETKSEAMRRY
ncbi:hypothetical protein KPL70_004324 [Citrus sinensis]|nr:hypothetical protein KPL70_004324 [Citrus sinensis]